MCHQQKKVALSSQRAGCILKGPCAVGTLSLPAAGEVYNSNLGLTIVHEGPDLGLSWLQACCCRALSLLFLTD